MGLRMDNNKFCFDGVVYEDTIKELRDFLQEKVPENLEFDFVECEDIHMAVIQMILAYKKLYSCKFTFNEKVKIYQTVLEGFDTSENYCS